MKKLVLAVFLTVFAFSNFGFVSDTGSKETIKHPCPFVQQMKASGECPFSKYDGTNKSECPYLSGKKSECPYMNGKVNGSESKVCPYSGKKGTKKSNSGQKVKLLEVKIS